MWRAGTYLTRASRRLALSRLGQSSAIPVIHPSQCCTLPRLSQSRHTADRIRAPSNHGYFCTSAESNSSYTNDKGEYAEIQRFPLPEGIPKDNFGLYELLDSSKDMRDIKGDNCVLAVHGSEDVWLPYGREGHGSGGGMYAVIGTSGTQYKVMTGDVLYTNRVAGEVNTQVVFDWVLAIGSFDWTVFGRPLIRGARVLATIEEQTKSAKVMVTKFKKRKGYLRRKGHRQPITRFRIDEIEFSLPQADMITRYEVPYDPKRPHVPNHLRSL